VGEIIYQGDSPFEVLPTQALTAHQSRDGVKMIVFASSPPQSPDAVQISIRLSPDQAQQLAADLTIAARKAKSWR
jgi:hypothetical protein